MWWTALAALASEPPSLGAATLHVGVHRDAGSVYDVAADGAAGQCAVLGSRLICPAYGPVTFRWPHPGFVLDGARVVEPGETGVAWVFADPDERAAERARLSDPNVDADLVRDLFVRTGDHPVLAPSRDMVDALLALADHPDPKVRRAVVESIVPYWRHTASDPFPADAPQLIPPGWIDKLAGDPDPVVRKRLANRLREVNMPGEPLQADAETTLRALATQPATQRPAVASLAVLSRDGRANLVESWHAALAAVTTPGPRGRAAANTFARLAAEIEAGPEVDPARALALVFQHHRERTWTVWGAWRRELPFDAAMFTALLRETEGTHAALVRHFADTDPEGLADALRRWEPHPPHSARWGLVTGPLIHHGAPAIQALFEP